MLSMPWSLRFRVPRPKSFVGILSLQTGAELISLSLVFNKATGVYGILTLVTGYALSALQLSAYLGSILVLAALALCLPHIRQHSPLHNLALAWVYAIDTVVGAAYTAAFAATWYLTATHEPKSLAEVEEDTGSQGNRGARRDRAQAAQTEAGAGIHETAASMVLVVGFTLIRVYFSLVMAAYARRILLRFVDERMGDSEGASDTVPDPFAVGAPLGEGWKGKLGRVMVLVGRGYWLERRKEDEEWARDVQSRFTSSSRA